MKVAVCLQYLFCYWNLMKQVMISKQNYYIIHALRDMYTKFYLLDLSWFKWRIRPGRPSEFSELYNPALLKIALLINIYLQLS